MMHVGTFLPTEVSMNDNLAGLVEGLKREIDKAVEEIKTDARMSKIMSLHQALNTLEESCGMAKTSLIDLFGLKTEMAISPGEFYGLEPLEAAKKFLRKRGQTTEFAEIVSGLRAGGCDLGNEEELRLSLARSTTQVVKVGDNLFGLVEFFPHVQRGRAGRKKKIEDAIDKVAEGTPAATVVEEMLKESEVESK